MSVFLDTQVRQVFWLPHHTINMAHDPSLVDALTALTAILTPLAAAVNRLDVFTSALNAHQQPAQVQQPLPQDPTPPQQQQSPTQTQQQPAPTQTQQQPAPNQTQVSQAAQQSPTQPGQSQSPAVPSQPQGQQPLAQANSRFRLHLPAGRPAMSATPGQPTGQGNDWSAALADVQGQITALQQFAFSAAPMSAQLLDVSTWGDALRTTADIPPARRYLEQYFNRLLLGPNSQPNQSLMNALVAQMELFVDTPQIIEVGAFRDAAHLLITELLVAKARADGIHPRALAVFRSSLQETGQPGFLTRALDTTRTIQRLTDNSVFRAENFARPAGKKKKRRNPNNNDANSDKSGRPP